MPKFNIFHLEIKEILESHTTPVKSMFQFRTIADTLRPGRRGATTLPRHIRGGTTDSGISESPSLTAGSYLPMDRLRFGNQSIIFLM